MFKKIFTAALLLVTLVLTGCGGGDKPGDTGNKDNKNAGNKLVIYTSMKESFP